MRKFLFNQEKSPISGKLSLTVVLHCAMIVVFGRLGNRPVLHILTVSREKVYWIF